MTVLSKTKWFGGLMIPVLCIAWVAMLECCGSNYAPTLPRGHGGSVLFRPGLFQQSMN